MSKINYRDSLLPLTISISIGLPLLLWGSLTSHGTVFSRGSNIFFFIAISLFIYKFIKDIIYSDISDCNLINILIFNVLIKYYLFSLGVYFIFNVFLTHMINVGIPFGHAGDFFHILDLAYANSYTEISQIGYLPGLLSIIKCISIIFMTKDGAIDRNFYGWALYLAILTISLYIACRPAIRANSAKIGLPIFLIFFTSYPFLLELERGNLVIFSMVFLALSIQLFSSAWSGVFLGIFATLKVLNVVFLPSFLFSRKVSLITLGVVILISGAIFPIILFNFSGSQVDYGGLFGRLASIGSFQDAHVAVAHSGAYATLTFFQNSGFFTHVDRQNFLRISMVLLLVLLFLYYFLEIYLFTVKKKFYSKKDLCFSLISIFIITKLFHQNNTDMNLVLLFPMMIQLFIEKLNSTEKLIFSLLLLLLFPFYINILFAIEELNSMFYYSSRTLIFSLIYLNVLILSFFRFFEIFKRNVFINEE